MGLVFLGSNQGVIGKKRTDPHKKSIDIDIDIQVLPSEGIYKETEC